MKLKDFIVTFLTEQNVNGMTVNLIGNFGKVLRLAQTRYSEYSNLILDKRLWTGRREVKRCMHYPVIQLKDGLYITDETRSHDEQTFLTFKGKLLELREELKTLPEEKPTKSVPVGVQALFTEQTIIVDENSDLKLAVAGTEDLVALTEFNFFNLGIFSYKDVAYYELVDQARGSLTRAELEKKDLIHILGQALVFMTTAGITTADHNTMSAYFSMVNR